MDKRNALVYGLAGLTLALSASAPCKAPATRSHEPTPVAPVGSAYQPAPVASPQTAIERKQPVLTATFTIPLNFGIHAVFENDLNINWNYQDGSDGVYVTYLDLEYKSPPSTTLPIQPRPNGNHLTLKPYGTNRSYQLLRENGRYCGPLNEKVEKDLAFLLYDNSGTEPRHIRTIMLPEKIGQRRHQVQASTGKQR